MVSATIPAGVRETRGLCGNRSVLPCLKKFVDLVDNFRGQANPIGVARHVNNPFLERAL
jgi:hypothetical protein